MADTESTLFEAFKRAERLGVGGSPFQQAMAGFKPGITPRAAANGPNSFEDIEVLGMPLRRPANAFRSVVPQGVRDVLGNTLQVLTSGEELGNFLSDEVFARILPDLPGFEPWENRHAGTRIAEALGGIPGAGGAARTAFDLASPLSALTAGAGGLAAAGLSKVPVLGRPAAGLVAPILTHPNTGVRFAGEVGVGLAGAAGAHLAGEVIPEDAPLPMQILGRISGGVAAGGLSASMISKALRPTTLRIGQSLDELAPAGAAMPRDLTADYSQNPGVFHAATRDTIRNAQTGQPLSLAGFRAETGTRVEGRGVYYAAHPDAIDYLVPAHARGGDPVAQARSVRELNFQNPLVLDGLSADELPAVLRTPAVEEAAARLIARPTEASSVEFDRAITQTAKDQGYDGLIMRSKGNLEQASEIVDLRPQHPLSVADAATRARLAQVAALDEAAPNARGAALATGDGTEATRAVPLTDEAVDTVDSYWQLARSARTGSASQHISLMDTGVRGLSTVAKSTILPRWLGKTLDGNVGRTPVMRRIASIAHSYMSNEANLAGTVATLFKHDIGRQFGNAFERVSLTLDAPSDLRRAWDIMQRSGNKLGMGNLVVEERQFFNLTDDQAKLLTNYDDYLAHDVALSKAMDVDIDEIKIPYARHVVELVDPTTSKTMDHKDFAFATARKLGSPLSFQMPRTFERTLDLINASLEDERGWRAAIDKALAAVTDPSEKQRLQNVLDSGVRLRLANAEFTDAFAQRLAEGGRARGESLAVSEAKRFGPAIEQDVRQILETQNISDTVQGAAKAAATLRSIVLNGDLSVFGVQGWGALVMGKGLKSFMSNLDGEMLKVIGTEEGFAKWTIANADRLSRAQLAGVEINSNVLEMTRGYTRDDLLEYTWRLKGEEIPGVTVAGAPLRKQGKGAPVVTQAGNVVRYLNDVQFRRMVTMWKLDSFEHVDDLVKVAATERGGRLKTLLHGHPLIGSLGKDPVSRSEEVGSFVNNLFGGLNRVDKGRSVNQNLIESIFALTPGFTRGTLAIGLNTLKPGLEGAIARDFAIRGMLLAGTLVTGLSLALNGLIDGKPVMPNLTDTSRDDWFDIPLPGGHSIRPMARFRSPAKIAFETAEEALTKNQLDAAKLFTKDALRWASYRQSALVGTVLGDPLGDVLGPEMGNRFARGHSIKDILFNPSTSRLADLFDMLSAVTPVPVQNMTEAIKLNGTSPQAMQDMALSIGVQFFGMSEFGPSLTERAVAETGAKLAQAAGLDPKVASLALASNRPAWNAKDDAGAYILPSNVRRQIAEQVAQETGLPVDLVQRGGNMSPREREAQYAAVQDAQIGTFVQGVKDVDAEYKRKVLALEEGVNRGLIGFEQYSATLTKLRLSRAGGKAALEGAAPAAILFLGSDAHKNTQNAKDALNSAISAEMFSQDFYDPYTGTFDFDAQSQLEARTRAKYGKAFDDWQAISEAKKTPLERERDKAFETMSQYFAVADDFWAQATGGAFGPNERAFDAGALKELAAVGITDPGQARLVLSELKKAIPQIKVAHEATHLGRQLMRIQDPNLDRSVAGWLGAKAVQLP